MYWLILDSSDNYTFWHKSIPNSQCNSSNVCFLIWSNSMQLTVPLHVI